MNVDRRVLVVYTDFVREHNCSPSVYCISRQPWSHIARDGDS